MVNYAIFELILAAILFISPSWKNASFKMIMQDGPEITLSVARNNIPGEFEGAHEYLVTMESGGERLIPLRFGFADNLLYRVSTDEYGKFKPFELDMASFHRQVKWDKLMSQKQEITSANCGKIVLQPGEKGLDLVVPDLKITLRIDRKYLKK